ncbi:MAG TPA: SulP family inorganic anion transporter [Rubrivivax sp.]|nr:SulP family inorganic anion transporter [Rubrivivax sp.]
MSYRSIAGDPDRDTDSPSQRLMPASWSSGDVWGGLAAMLVAFPAAIAFGVTVYSSIGPAYAGLGAIAGIVGAVVIGLVAALLGGTDRLVSTPCAPAAAVLSAFAVESVASGAAPQLTVLMILVVGLLAGLVQVALGLMGVGRIIKYIPYPVVSGYLTGVGLIIIGSQIGKLLGVSDGLRWWQALADPAAWDWRALLIGLVTAGVTVAAPRVTRRLPGIIVGIAAGVAAYALLAAFDPALRRLEGNPLVIGALDFSADGYVSDLMGRWAEIGSISVSQLVALLGAALTLGVLLSIDTLKTCVVLDQLTRSRHESNRELIAQGVANCSANALGGISGAGQMGATLVGLNSGASSRACGVFEGLFSLVAALLATSFVAWIPVATLAGILVVIGLRMIDRAPLQFLRARETLLDFGVVVAVVVVALTVGLIAASAVGVGLAMLLFVREQIGGVVVRHKVLLGQTSSSWHRPQRELEVLAAKGDRAVIFSLQGSLFFGNTYQLYTDLEHEIATRDYVIIDLRRVRSIDVTAAHLFKQIRDAIKERGAKLVLCGVRGTEAARGNVRELLSTSGVVRPDSKTVRVFADLDTAIAWVEDRLLGEEEDPESEGEPMDLAAMELFAGYREDTLRDLAALMEVRRYPAGAVIYERGAEGRELFWVRRGSVRLVAAIDGSQHRPMASFGRGDFFGGLAFLDGESRPNNAVAVTDTETYVLSRERFNEFSKVHRTLAFNLAMSMARIVATRLRRAEAQLAMLQE